MALHTDQSAEAQKAVWAACKERCVYCQESHGWWQGVVEATDNGPRFMCVICAAIRSRVPVPEGFIRLQISEVALESWGLKERFDTKFKYNQPTQTMQHAMPLLIAWMVENEKLQPRALLDHKIYPTDHKKEDKTFPMVLRRPIWWSSSNHFVVDIEKYADSNEDREITAVIRAVLGDPDWSRTTFAEFHGVYSPMNAWSVGLNEKHPATARGLHFVEVLPWLEIMKRRSVTVSGCIIDSSVHYEPVEQAMKALVQSRVATTDQTLWKALGLG
jgi:hypothetical protein